MRKHLFKLDDGTEDALDHIMDVYDCDRSDAVAKAIHLMSELIDLHNDGYSIRASRPETYPFIISPVNR